MTSVPFAAGAGPTGDPDLAGPKDRSADGSAPNG